MYWFVPDRTFGLSIIALVGSMVNVAEHPLVAARRRHYYSERSLSWNLLEFGVLAKLPAQPTAKRARGTDPALRDPGEDRKERGRKLSEDLLILLRDYCAKRGIRLMIVGIPTLAQVDAIEEPVTTLAEIGSRISVPTVDLLEPLQEAARADRGRGAAAEQSCSGSLWALR